MAIAAKSTYYPGILSWTRLSVRFLDSVAQTRKLRIVILRKAFVIKSMGLKMCFQIHRQYYPMDEQ